MEYIGLDYHTRYAISTRMNKKGQILSKDRIVNTKDAIRSYFTKVPAGSQVVLEATNNWAAFAEWTYDLPLKIKLANPGKTKAIASAKIKTDTIDSRVLADLLRTNYLAESYLAPRNVRDIRELVRYRMTLVRLRSQIKARIRSILFKIGEEVTARDILGAKAAGEMSALKMRAIYREEIESSLLIAKSLTQQIELFEERIQEKADLDADTKLLMTIPGISFFSALLVTSEIGDYQRFRSGKKLCCFAGLVPSIHASGGKVREGRIIKQGSANLRFALLQAVPHLIRKHERLASYYYKIVKRKGVKTARIAISRKLLTIIFSMLKTKTVFRVDQERKEQFTNINGLSASVLASI